MRADKGLLTRGLEVTEKMMKNYGIVKGGEDKNDVLLVHSQTFSKSIPETILDMKEWLNSAGLC